MCLQDECVAEPLLSGCVMEQPCRLPDLGPVPCMCGSPGRPREAQGSWDLATGQKVEHPPGVSL